MITLSIFQACKEFICQPWPVFYTCIVTIIINLPFGYLRAGTRKFSLMWFLAVHAPVPLVILTRKFFNLELSWRLAPFLFGSYILGQWLGKKIKDRYKRTSRN